MKSDKVLIIADLLTNYLHYDFGLLNRFLENGYLCKTGTK